MSSRTGPVTRAKVHPKHFIISQKQNFPGGHAESLGKRPTMEDACAILGNFAGPDTQFYGVFDGHSGCEASIYSMYSLPPLIAKRYFPGSNMNDILRESFAELNETILKDYPWSGTTAAVAVISDNFLTTANVGDSRIILISPDGHAERLSYDHRISDPTERDAVLSRGGIIQDNRLNGYLNLSRTLGDGEFANFLSAEPCIRQINRVDGMKLIIACDGVWDSLTDQQAADIFIEHTVPGEAARAIQAAAMRNGSDDNITVICVNLTPK